MIRRLLAILPLAALSVLVAFAVFMLTRPTQPQTITAGDVARPAPAYNLPRLGGGAPVTPEAFAGRTYLINVFASTCVPCAAESAQLLELKARGVAILGVANKDRPEDTQAFLAAHGDPYEAVAVDRDGRYSLDLGYAGMPETFVVGPDGRIRAVIRNPLTEENVRRELMPALAGNS